jgi:hypothetical protein
MTDIHYPIFLQLSQLSECEQGWRNIYIQMALNQLPSYQLSFFRIDKFKACICFNGKPKWRYTFPIYSDDATDLHCDAMVCKTDLNAIHHDIYSLFTTRGVEFNCDMNESNPNIVAFAKWDDIQLKSNRDLLIEMYVCEKGKEHHLTFNEMNALLNKIQLYISLKLLTSNDFIIQDSRLHSIKGIEYFERGYTFAKTFRNL